MGTDDLGRRLAGSFREAQERRLVERALATGALTPEQADEVLAGGTALSDRLTPEQVAALERAQAEEDLRRPTGRPPPPDEVRAFLRDPERQIGDFVLCQRRGHGGAGEVWRAWDRNLGRFVAVKLPAAQIGSRSAAERFAREATAVAQLQHSNIVPLYQSGVHEGRPYLVMPFIEGRTLEESSLSVTEAVRVVRDAALAVHHAHERGIVHRDLKPGNLMLDADGRVHVLDFGLAYLKAGRSDVTGAGAVLGTAAYMSPEQARGEDGGRSPLTDVYGLGATLHRLLSGQAPFVGDSVSAVIAQVLHKEPAALNVERRLARVVAKAMEKSPARRYPTAQAFADDLGRVLAGQSVLARPPGLARRLGRHPWLLAAVVVLGAGAYVATERRREKQESLDAVRALARVTLETAQRLRRSGDLAGMQVLLPQLTQAYERAQRTAPGVPDVDHLMGRLHRALLDEDRALHYQERALAHTPDFAPALYERAVLLSRRYGRLRESRVALEGSEAAESHELGRLRSQILADGRRLETMQLEETSALAVRGLIAHHDGRGDEARALLRQALSRDPDREEIWETLGAEEERRQAWAAAEAVYNQGLSRDRGYLPLLLGRCRVYSRWGRGRTQAIADATAVIKATPHLVEAWLCRATCRTYEANAAAWRGQASQQLFDEAEADFSAALARAPQHADTLWARGALYRYRASAASRRGRDPLPDLDKALADLRRAAQLVPDRVSFPTAVARVKTLIGAAEAERGRDPEPHFKEAEARFAAMLAREPSRPDALEWQGDLFARWAMWHRGDRAKAEELFTRAERSFTRSLEAFRTNRWGYLHRGRARLWRGDVTADTADVHWRAALSDLDQAVQQLADIPDSWLERAAAKERLATRARGQEKATLLQAARSDRQRAAAIDPCVVRPFEENSLAKECTMRAP